jgi:hypothetical protein
MEDYRKVATTMIQRLGGIEQVRFLVTYDRRKFLMESLPGALKECYREEVPDKDAVYSHILDILRR